MKISNRYLCQKLVGMNGWLPGVKLEFVAGEIPVRLVLFTLPNCIVSILLWVWTLNQSCFILLNMIHYLWVIFQYISKEACNQKLHYDGQVLWGMFCAGELNSGGKDACQGDSGGPMTQDEKVILYFQYNINNIIKDSLIMFILSLLEW